MPEFMLIYAGGDPNWATRWGPEKRDAVMKQWGDWFAQLETDGHLKNPGAALAPGGAQLSTKDGQIVTDAPLPEVKELVGGFSIIEAETLEQATEIAKGSPILAGDDGGSVIVRPVVAT